MLKSQRTEAPISDEPHKTRRAFLGAAAAGEQDLQTSVTPVRIASED